MSNIQEILISKDGTHHTQHGRPLYDKVFFKVMKFHSPGLAPVEDASGAYHILLTGQAAYSMRYKKTYGFYDSLSCVIDQKGWVHIDQCGDPIYERRYLWCGNFQENVCAVKDKLGYFHINRLGDEIYSKRYNYAGDYKDGHAVVCQDGVYWHIDRFGNPIHDKTFLFLDVFHKGYARAQDGSGWFHVDYSGEPMYEDRYQYVEPFYNDYALVQLFDGSFVRIDVRGNISESLLKKRKEKTQNDYIGELSGKLIGFWQTYIIHAAVKLNLLEHLPASTSEIASRCDLNESNTKRMMRALWEINIVNATDDIWHLTELGALLVPQQTSFMAAATTMWVDVCKEWRNLMPLIQKGESKYHPCFKDDASLEKLSVYQMALEGYAKNDFSDICQYISFRNHEHIFVAGSCARFIIPRLLDSNDTIHATYYDLEKRLRGFSVKSSLKERLRVESFDLCQKWPCSYDAIILPRFMHYFPDEVVKSILTQIKNSLSKDGVLILLEMLLDDSSCTGGMLDINMMVETNGRLRTKEEWLVFTRENNLKLIRHLEIKPYLSMLEFKHE